MFDFLFKRRSDSSSSAPATARQQHPTVQADPTQPMLVRQVAMKTAQALTDETSAVGFILQCEFADARLQAADLIRSKPLLEQVALAMRNADRRVAKLMQSRLDALTQQVARQQQAQVCLDQAQRLMQEQLLMPSQVAELDRAWQAIDVPPQALLDSFEQTRNALRERLHEQAVLQRTVIDGLTRLRGVMDGDPLQTRGAQALDTLEQELAAHFAAREAPSLPKNMLSDFAQKLQAARQALATLAARQEELAARDQAALRIAEAPKPTEAALPAPVHIAQSDTRQSVLEAVAGMERALQDGALQTAIEHDKALRNIDLKAARLSETQTARLATARSELSRLQGWAKWGGNISREELLKAADGLPAQTLAAAELAKKVGSLRERWKSLDVSAGAASKELWERFDAACTIAYAPAAEHFKKLADERQNNSAKALAMIAEVRQFATANDGNAEDGVAVDWKAVAAFCLRTTQAWRHLGAIDRKERKRLDAEFDLAMQTLSVPLARQREVEIQRREKLIAQAAALNPNERGALENLRALQELWQEQAKSLPLERQDEQQLWQRFRSACDAVFAKRKEGAAAADVERRQNLHAKEALCARLEAALETGEAGEEGEAAIKTVLREGRDGWNKIGQVPRASEGQVEARFKSAVTALQSRLDAAKRAAAAAEQDTLRAKLQLCRQLEQALADCIAPESGTEQHWQTLPLLAADTERTLRARFDAALRAVQANDRQYASILEQNRATLANALLRCEMTAGIDSPAELSRERLRLQVEVLQSSFKAGQEPLADDAQLLRLLGLAALADTETCARIDRLLSITHDGR